MVSPVVMAAITVINISPLLLLSLKVGSFAALQGAWDLILIHDCVPSPIGPQVFIERIRPRRVGLYRDLHGPLAARDRRKSFEICYLASLVRVSSRVPAASFPKVPAARAKISLCIRHLVTAFLSTLQMVELLRSFAAVLVPRAIQLALSSLLLAVVVRLAVIVRCALVVIISATALLVGLTDHVHALLHLGEVLVAEIDDVYRRPAVALEHGLVASLPAVVEAHVDPGSFPHTQMFAHITIFAIFRHLIGHPSLSHVILEGLLTAFLHDFDGFVLGKDVFIWQIFGRKLPLKSSFAAFPEFERLWRANLNVPLQELDILDTWVPSQVVDQPRVQRVIRVARLPHNRLFKPSHSSQLEGMELCLELVLDEQLGLVAAQAPLPLRREAPEQIRVHSLLLDIPDDVKLVTDPILRLD